MNCKKAFCILCAAAALTLTGCSYPGVNPAPEPAPVENTEYTTLGRLTVHNTDERLILTDLKDALSADGLYYASWAAGDSKAYENSEGETVTLHDAQLYLLLGEYQDAGAAETNKEDWLSAGRSNYEVTEEENFDCNGQSYTLLTYRFTNEENPYARGTSAFGVYENCALCVEFTCREYYEEDLKEMLKDFLAGCSFQ